MNNLQRELARRATPPLTVKEINARLEALGYRLERSLDCRCNALYVDGAHDGDTYPCITVNIRHKASKMSFANVDAPRGADFQALQALRLSGELYAVTRDGYILEV
jgi:hypothetical protein